MEKINVSDEELVSLMKEIKGKMIGETLVNAMQHLDRRKTLDEVILELAKGGMDENIRQEMLAKIAKAKEEHFDEYLAKLKRNKDIAIG